MIETMYARTLGLDRSKDEFRYKLHYLLLIRDRYRQIAAIVSIWSGFVICDQCMSRESETKVLLERAHNYKRIFPVCIVHSSTATVKNMGQTFLEKVMRNILFYFNEKHKFLENSTEV